MYKFPASEVQFTDSHRFKGGTICDGNIGYDQEPYQGHEKVTFLGPQFLDIVLIIFHLYVND